MRYAIYYVSIGTAVAVISQFTIARGQTSAFKRMGAFVVLIFVWPIVLLVAAPDLLGIKLKSKYKGAAGRMPSLYGGDGLTADTAVVVNCAAMTTAVDLMAYFISKRHGELGSELTEGLQMSVVDGKDPAKSVRSITVDIPSGDRVTYYFDLSRPFAATINCSGKL